jgi:hypothetical protein
MPLPAHSQGLLVLDYCLWQYLQRHVYEILYHKRSEEFAVIREEMLQLMTDFT